MTDLPPPVGRPAAMFPRPDPWVEQARRDAAHRAERRRRRRRWLVPLVVVVAIGASFAIGAGLFEAFGSATDDADGALGVPSPSVVATAPEPSATLAPSDLVAVDEVWLVDRGDDTFDWGVAVRTQTDASARSGVEVTVRLLDARGEVVDTASDILGVIDADSPAAIAGRLAEPAAQPVRIEFDVSVGRESDSAALADLFDVRALTREGDVLTGRIRSRAPNEIGDLAVLFVWHDEAGSVIGTAPLDIERLRPGVDARFELDLTDEVVPEGRPDAVFWIR